jgi:purine-nucleoside phosphorylase
LSAASWIFNPGESEEQLVKEVCRQTQVERFDLAVVLGSGWDEVAGLGETLGVFAYKDWSCFPAGQITGHKGQLIAVRFSGWNILFFSGRFHCYQGLSAFQAAFPTRLASSLGCLRILLTCATGGINRTFHPGHFMLVEDHLNLLGDNPLRGLPGNAFIDLVNAYQSEVYDCLQQRCPDNLILHRGILAAMPGPSYETPAEIRYLQAMGADVVSMSTVPEVIMGRFLGMQVTAVAFIANHAAGLHAVPLSHQEVLACGAKHAHLFAPLVHLFVDAWQTVNSTSPD